MYILNLYYKQQFRNYEKKFWLPVDYRVDGDIKIGIFGLQFPRIKYKRITALSDYSTNIPLPDSLYQKDKPLIEDSLSIARDSLFATHTVQIPLTHTETAAYETLDSTMTLRKAFKPTGFLADMIEMTTEDEENREGDPGLLSWFSPQLWYNRVDELHLGLTVQPDFSKAVTFCGMCCRICGAGRWLAHTECQHLPPGLEKPGRVLAATYLAGTRLAA